MVLQFYCCANASYYATPCTTLLLHKNGWNMTCIVLKQDRYYKMMAGITCFCCPNKVVFSIPTESQPPHAVFCVLVVSIYSCCEYRQLGGGKLHCQKYLRMAVVLCSFKFVVHGKKLLRNNFCFWHGLLWYSLPDKFKTQSSPCLN